MLACIARVSPRRRSSAAGAGLLVLLAALAGVVPAGALGTGLAPGTAAPAAAPGWDLDSDGNGLADALDADLAAGLAGPVLLHVLYDRRPTAGDASLLEDLGADRTYVFRNFDVVKAEADAARIPGLTAAGGVVGIERFVPPELQNNVGARALRVRANAGIVELGRDHALAVHETLGLRGEGMVVAVLDTGANNLHESLDDQDDDPATADPKLVQRPGPGGVAVVAGADASTGFAILECVDPPDDHGHGTHTAGTAVGTGGPSGTYRGAAPRARLVDVDISTPNGVGLGEDLGFDWIISFNRGETCYGPPGADAIDVATMSFGAGGDNPNSTLSRMITDVARSGITFTVSAANGGPNANTLGTGAEGAIMVAADDDRGTVGLADDRIASFSSRGPRRSDGDTHAVDEMRPDIAAPGVSIASANAKSLSGYVSFSGTSMSAPFVGGIAALMLQANPGLRPVDLGSNQAMGNDGAVPVRDLLQKTATYLANATTAPQSSGPGRFGLPWNNAYGYGVADAYAAVRLALDSGGLVGIAGGPHQATAGAPVAFAASAQGGTAPYSFHWAFGDGATATGATPSHAYAAGDFVVLLTVTDANGATDTATTTVKALPSGPPPPPPPPPPPAVPTGQRMASFGFDSPECLDAEGWFVSQGSIVVGVPPGPGLPWHLTSSVPSTAPCAWWNAAGATGTVTHNSQWHLDSPGGGGCLALPAGTQAAALWFNVTGRMELNYDYVHVQVRTGSCIDGPAGTVGQAGTFATILSMTGAKGNVSAGLYERVRVPLDAVVAAGNGPFQVRFRSVTDPAVTDVGYRLDDVEVWIEA